LRCLAKPPSISEAVVESNIFTPIDNAGRARHDAWRAPRYPGSAAIFGGAGDYGTVTRTQPSSSKWWWTTTAFQSSISA